MGVLQKQLTSTSGFRSPGFSVDGSGNLSAASIDTTGGLTIAGLPFITGNSLATTIIGSSLKTLGQLTELHAGATGQSLDDVLTVTSTGITTSALTKVSLNNGLLVIDPSTAPNQVSVAADLTVSGTLSATSATTSTSATTGAVVVTGGAGIGKNLYVGGNTYITGNTYIGGQNIKALAAALAVALS
jgi:hypothetical protein